MYNKILEYHNIISMYLNGFFKIKKQQQKSDNNLNNFGINIIYVLLSSFQIHLVTMIMSLRESHQHFLCSHVKTIMSI